MSLHRVRTRLRRELAEHEKGARDGHEPTAEAHRVFGAHVADDLAAVEAAIEGADAIEKTLRAEIERLRALPVIATCGSCGWARDAAFTSPHVLCSMVTHNSAGWRVAMPHGTEPPKWCPMRKGER